MSFKWGVLESEGFFRQSNPLFNNNFIINSNADNLTREFKISGKGRTKKIAFLTDNLYLTLAVSIDGSEFYKINNGFCMLNICDSTHRGEVLIEKVYEELETYGLRYRYAFFNNFVFDKNITLRFESEKDAASVYGLHIYYEVFYE